MSRATLVMAAALATLAVLAVGTLRSLPSRPTPSKPAALGRLADCHRYSGLPPGFARDPVAGMQWIEGGRFTLGSLRGYAEERPELEQKVAGFWIDRSEVSNAQFAAFVAATGYRTEAEQQGMAVGFQPPASPDAEVAPNRWWVLRRGADWRHPQGPDSRTDGRDNRPVVNVTFNDALAYAHWLGHDLPSEAQWEYAARGGLDNTSADAQARGTAAQAGANAWQGLFPFNDEGRDGFRGIAPVGCFPANRYGLFDMVGNVWEWTHDPYRAHHAATAPVAGSAELKRVIKGGSYLCSDNWCARARASSRQSQESDLAAVHLGFRTVRVAH